MAKVPFGFKLKAVNKTYDRDNIRYEIVLKKWYKPFLFAKVFWFNMEVEPAILKPLLIPYVMVWSIFQ